MAKRATSSFIDEEKKVLNAVAKTIGATLGQVAALGQVVQKARRAKVKPARRRRARAKSQPPKKNRKRKAALRKSPSGAKRLRR